MNCSNCGAPMRLVRERDYFFCEYCGSFHFPREAEEGVRILQEDPDGLACPACGQTLAQASLDGNLALACSRCRGLLLPQPTFANLVLLRRSQARGPGKPLRALNTEELERRIRCPRCQGEMHTHPYLGPGNVIVDNCPHCHLIWLDAGELSAIEDAPGRDRGGEPPDPATDRAEESWLEKYLRKQGKYWK